MSRVALGVSRDDSLFQHPHKRKCPPQANNNRKVPVFPSWLAQKRRVRNSHRSRKSNEKRREKTCRSVMMLHAPRACMVASVFVPSSPVSTSPGKPPSQPASQPATLLQLLCMVHVCIGTQDLHDSILVMPHAHMYWWWWWWCGFENGCHYPPLIFALDLVFLLPFFCGRRCGTRWMLLLLLLLWLSGSGSLVGACQGQDQCVVTLKHQQPSYMIGRCRCFLESRQDRRGRKKQHRVSKKYTKGPCLAATTTTAVSSITHPPPEKGVSHKKNHRHL
jgi:hypothetical protein